MGRRDDSELGYSGGASDLRALADVIRRMEDNYRHAREQSRQIADTLDKGQGLLRELTHLDPTQPSRPAPGTLTSKEPGGGEPMGSSRADRQASTVWPVDSEASHRPVLRIYSLGTFIVRCGNRTIPNWRNNRAKAILKLMLIHSGKSLPRDVFIEAFWPDSPVASANNSFRVAIHELRQALGSLGPGGTTPTYIVSQGANYFLNLEAPVWIDVAEFMEFWQTGRAFEKAGRHVDAVAEFRKAERLYLGDFLEEDLYEEWALLRREELVDIYLSILGRLIEYHFSTDDFDTCVDLSQKILAKDNCSEDAYRYLISCYTKLGQRSRALRWYRLCEETLRRELDCAPSAETMALYESVLHRRG